MAKKVLILGQKRNVLFSQLPEAVSFVNVCLRAVSQDEPQPVPAKDGSNVQAFNPPLFLRTTIASML